MQTENNFTQDYTQIEELLKPNLSQADAKVLQQKWSVWFQAKEKTFPKITTEKTIHTIAGIDVAFPSVNPTHGIACAVLWDIEQKKIITDSIVEDQVTFPYIPGLLAFHEGSLIVKAIRALSQVPDAIMLDGHGYLHPLRFGEAIHVGAILNLPSMGIAKTKFIGEYNLAKFKRQRGYMTPILANDFPATHPAFNEILGYSICLTDNTSPVFVSRGFRMELSVAINLALLTTISHRQPEPLTEAHIRANQIIRERSKKE
jgi:deoxyribonuclease V